MTPERGQLVWIDFNPRKGHEQSGRRPAVVISPAAYNAVSSCVLVCPITANTDPWPWKVVLPEGSGIPGAILVYQLKSVDPHARHLDTTEHSVGQDVVAEVLARLATLVG